VGENLQLKDGIQRKLAEKPEIRAINLSQIVELPIYIQLNAANSTLGVV
jgi:hypothetical protein